MPTVNEVLGGILQNAIAHPKTTLQSIFTTLLFGDLMLLGCGCLSTKSTALAGGVLSVAKIGLGMMQTDGSKLVVPLGTTVTSDTHVDVTTPSATIKS